MDLKSNEPFWLVKNGLIHSYSSLKSDESCDILIVGSGITGSLIAHQCIQDGHNVILIDKREVCNGSSSATTSMLQYEIDIPLCKLIETIGEAGAIASYAACSNAIDKLSKIAKSIGSEAGFTAKKSLYYAARKKDLSLLKTEYEIRKKHGYVVSWLDETEILEKHGIAKAYGGILSAQGGSVDAFRLAHELLCFNQKKGLKIFDKTALTNVESSKNMHSCSTNTGFNIRAKKIIYCTGYETVNLIPEKFVKLLSSFALVSEVDEKLYNKYKDLLIWNTAEPYLYMRTTDDGRFLIGGEDEEFQNPEKRDALVGKKEQKLIQAFEKTFPNQKLYSDFAWAGTFGETKDGLPYIGEHPTFKNAYFVCGFGGNGITFSVTGMEMVSDWLKGEKHELSKWFGFGR